MRAMAILFVVCSHSLWVFPSQTGSFQTLLRFAGFLGVEVFFVLSGFLIGNLLFKLFTAPNFSPKKLGYFLVRRWFRTFPNYYLALILNIVIVWYLGRELPETLGRYFFFLQNTTFGMDIFFTESWSLPIEEFAYLLGPILLYALLLLKIPFSRKIVFLVITLLVLIFFLGSKIIYQLNHGETTMDFWNIHLKAVVLYRVDSIYYGVLAAYLYNVFPKLWERHKTTMFLASIVMFLGLHLGVTKLSDAVEIGSWMMNVWYLPCCSLSIALSLPFFSTWKKTTGWSLKSITFISLISYSMYLLHYSIVLQLMHYFIGLQEGSWGYQVVFSIGYMTVTVLCSYLLYRWYEKPLMNLRDHSKVKKWFVI